jgi:tetratricopeptide (TPR) repeat protein
LLATVHTGEQRYEDAYEVLIRLSPLLGGEERVDLLVEIGRLAKSELDDPYRAIDAYEDANRQRPADRNVLEALLGLYRQTRQGPRAVEVLEELVRIEPDEKSRVRLNQTLGEVYRDEVKNEARAVQYFNAALDLDPTFVKAFESIETVLSSSQNWPALEQNYIGMLKRLPATDKHGIKEVIWRNLGDLYRYRLKNLDGATQAYTVLAKLQPQNADVLEVLADLLGKNPGAIDDAIAAHLRLVQMQADRPQRALHELVRLYLHKKASDRAFVTVGALKLIGDAQPKELELFEVYAKQAAASSVKRALTEKLWEALLVHPGARGPMAQLSAVLWRSAGSVLAKQQKDYGLDKKKVWEKRDLDAPVPLLFVSQLVAVRNVLATGGFELFEHVGGAEPLTPLCLESPTLAMGKASPLLGETNRRALWFVIARQLTSLRASFLLPRTLGAEGFQALVDAAIHMVEPRYPQRAESAAAEALLAKVGAPLVAAIRPYVLELLKSKTTVSVKPFLEAMEHTAIRAGYLLTGDLDLAAQLLKQPDVGVLPLAYGQKLKELVQFAVSEEHFELRARLGMAIGT